MSIFNHNIYENILTRVIVLHQGCMLMIPPGSSAPEVAWSLPGGGLHPHESLAECARREVLEETGIQVRVGRIAFLRERIVPRYVQSTAPDPDGRGHGYGLEVFYYATPEELVPAPRPEEPDAPPARWCRSPSCLRCRSGRRNLRSSANDCSGASAGRECLHPGPIGEPLGQSGARSVRVADNAPCPSGSRRI